MTKANLSVEPHLFLGGCFSVAQASLLLMSPSLPQLYSCVWEQNWVSAQDGEAVELGGVGVGGQTGK